MVDQHDWPSRKEYFHNPAVSFWGKAYEKARAGWTSRGKSPPIEWDLLIDFYDQETGEDHHHVRQMIALGV